MNQPVTRSTSATISTSAFVADITRGGLPGLLAQLAAVHAAGESAVLGIVTKTEGSTYQKPGALILTDRHGMRFGVLSGGCLEPQVEDAAQRALRSGEGGLIEFDTRTEDDLIFGSGTGCRGRTQLLLLPQPPGAPLTEALRVLANSTGTLTLELTTQGTHVGVGTAQLEQQRWCWQKDGRGAERASEPDVRVELQSPPRLVLLGAGPETAPLLTFGSRLGWHLRVVEHRGRWQQFALQAGVTDLWPLDPDAAQREWSKIRPDAALIMTHNYSLDLQHLRHCAVSAVGYVGLLGPSQRREALLQELGADLVERLGARLHAPIGLDIGGSGPEALALSIAGEVQQYLTTHGRVR